MADKERAAGAGAAAGRQQAPQTLAGMHSMQKMFHNVKLELNPGWLGL